MPPDFGQRLTVCVCVYIYILRFRDDAQKVLHWPAVVTAAAAEDASWISFAVLPFNIL